MKKSNRTQGKKKLLRFFFRTCIFCGKFDEAFEGSGLDLHYWKSCPLLTRCSFCKQVVEIASLTQHLLGKYVNACIDFQ